MGSHFVFLLSVMIGYFLVNAPTYRFKRSVYFSKYLVGIFHPVFFPIFLMFLHLRVDCLIIENLETLESDRNCSISVHFSCSLVILRSFDKKKQSYWAWIGDSLMWRYDVRLAARRYPVRTFVTGWQLGGNLAWWGGGGRHCFTSGTANSSSSSSDVNSTLYKVKIETPCSVRVA